MSYFFLVLTGLKVTVEFLVVTILLFLIATSLEYSSYVAPFAFLTIALVKSNAFTLVIAKESTTFLIE